MIDDQNSGGIQSWKLSFDPVPLPLSSLHLSPGHRWSQCSLVVSELLMALRSAWAHCYYFILCLRTELTHGAPEAVYNSRFGKSGVVHRTCQFSSAQAVSGFLFQKLRIILGLMWKWNNNKKRKSGETSPITKEGKKKE